MPDSSETQKLQPEAAHEAPAPTSGGSRRTLWRYVPIGLIILAIIGFFLAGGQQYLSFSKVMESRDRLAAFVSEHWALAIATYVGVYVLAIALSLPGALALTIIGGFLFGGWVGGIVTICAATLGATLLFLAARTSLGESLAARIGPRLSRLRQGFQEDAVSYMFFLRLVPVFPFWLVNLAPALLGVPLRTFVWTTFLGVIPGTLAFSLAGAGLDSVAISQREAFDACIAAGKQNCTFSVSPGDLVTGELLLAFAAIGVAALIPVVYKKWRAARRPQ